MMTALPLSLTRELKLLKPYRFLVLFLSFIFLILVNKHMKHDTDYLLFYCCLSLYLKLLYIIITGRPKLSYHATRN